MDAMQRLCAVVKQVFDDEIDISGANEDTKLKELGINSVGLLYMAIALEEEFGVKFLNSDIGQIQTVGDVVKRIEAKNEMDRG